MTNRVGPNPSVRELSFAVNQLVEGKLNSISTVTLSSGTSTTVSDRRVGVSSVVLLMPSNSAASSVSWYVTTSDASFIIHHSSASGTETFAYAVIGG